MRCCAALHTPCASACLYEGERNRENTIRRGGWEDKAVWMERKVGVSCCCRYMQRKIARRHGGQGRVVMKWWADECECVAWLRIRASKQTHNKVSRGAGTTQQKTDVQAHSVRSPGPCYSSAIAASTAGSADPSPAKPASLPSPAPMLSSGCSSWQYTARILCAHSSTCCWAEAARSPSGKDSTQWPLQGGRGEVAGTGERC